VLLTDGRRLWRTARTDGSYASSSDRRVHFGLGEAAGIEGVLVQWLGGEPELFRDVPIKRLVHLRQGSGEPAAE